MRKKLKIKDIMNKAHISSHNKKKFSLMEKALLKSPDLNTN